MRNMQNQLNQIQQMLEIMNITHQYGGDRATNFESGPDVEDLPPRRNWLNQHQANTTHWDQGIKIEVGEFEGRLEPVKFLDSKVWIWQKVKLIRTKEPSNAS